MNQHSLCKGEENVLHGVRQQIRSELAKDEELVWMGQPLAFIIMLQYIHYFLVGGAVLVAGIYFYQGQVVMPVPIVFILIGIGVLGIPVLQYAAAKFTGYALTSKRTIVLLQKPTGRKRLIYKPSDLVFMQREDLPNPAGAGHLIFYSEKIVDSTQDQAGHISTTEKTINYGFMAIENIDEIERLVKKTLLNKKSH